MRGGKIQIWFFIGVMLLLYGALITAYGLSEFVTGKLAPVQLAELHAPLWWGGTLLVLGAIYTLKFRPGRGR